jgi:hypothetical protein
MKYNKKSPNLSKDMNIQAFKSPYRGEIQDGD